MFRKSILYTKPFLISLLLLSTAYADDAKWKLKESNDYFTFFNEDSDYTQGLEVSRSTESSTIAFGQDIYTPLHKKINPPNPEERPYAGYMYLNFEFNEPLDNENKFFYGIQPGWVGPGARGKQAQCTVHSLLDQHCPKGWPSQLHNEPALTLRAGILNTQYLDMGFLSGEQNTKLLLEAGNVRSKLHLDTQIKWEGLGLYYFAGPGVDLIARNIFLDGNTWQESPSVDKKILVSELKGGVGYKYHNYGVMWFIAVKSPEFEQQHGSYNYGGIELSW